jgi:hypothetical protein
MKIVKLKSAGQRVIFNKISTIGQVKPDITIIHRLRISDHNCQRCNNDQKNKRYYYLIAVVRIDSSHLSQ